MELADQGRQRPAGLPALSDFTHDIAALCVTPAERSVTDAGVQEQALCTLCSLVLRQGLAEDEVKRRCRILTTAAVPWIIRVLAQHPVHPAIAEYGLFLLRRVSWASEDKVRMLFVCGQR